MPAIWMMTRCCSRPRSDGETTSGYARIVKQWQRGEPLAAAKILFEGQASDVASSPAVFHAKAAIFGVVIRAVTFFETEYFLVGNGTVAQAAIAAIGKSARRHDRGVTHLIVTLREDWKPGR